MLPFDFVESSISGRFIGLDILSKSQGVAIGLNIRKAFSLFCRTKRIFPKRGNIYVTQCTALGKKNKTKNT